MPKRIAKADLRVFHPPQKNSLDSLATSTTFSKVRVARKTHLYREEGGASSTGHLL